MTVPRAPRPRPARGAWQDAGLGPRLAIAANSGEIGGGEVMLLQIARALRTLGMSPVVLGPRTDGGIVDAAVAEGFPVLPLAGPGRAAYMRSLALWRTRNPRAPLWCNGMVPALATAGAGARIVHLHAMPPEPRALSVRVAGGGARSLVVPSAWMAAEVRGAVPLDNWTGDHGRHGGTRAPDPGPAPLRIGFLGRTTLAKGIGVLREAVGRVLGRRPGSVRLVIAGENRFGSRDDDRELSLLQRELAGSVESVGWVDTGRFLAAIDALVVPSVLPETFGLVAAEAMSARVPLIVSDAGALPEVAGPGHPWIARHGEAADLARVLEELLDASPQDRLRAVAAARARWEQRYSPAAGRARLHALLTGLDRPPDRGGSEQR